MTAAYQRAMVLYAQQRYADAEQELRRYLGDEPNSADGYAMLGLCLSHLDRHTEASAEAKRAIGQAPFLAFPHYALAYTLWRRDRLQEAKRSIEQAVGMEPQRADYLGLLAAIELDLRRWPAALEAAERGLMFDPENVQCTNLRAMALVNLGRRSEAGATIDAALRRSPEDAHTHANQGWTLLHQGKPKEAMQHFREALRLDPNMEWARSGIIEAMKARFILYRWVLAYFLWMARLNRRAQWAILVGGYLGYRYLANYADTHPGSGKYIWPLLIAYIVFGVMTWLAYPLFNLALRLSRFGRLALTRSQRIESNLVGGLLLVASIMALVGWQQKNKLLVISAVIVALLMLPATGVFRVPKGWPQIVMIVAAALLAAAGLGIAVLLIVLPRMSSAEQQVIGPPLIKALQAFGWAILIVSFGRNWLGMIRVKK